MGAFYGCIPVISIHALRGEGDHGKTTEYATPVVFQSTPSVGRATIVGR